jgi:hypothetical protein
MKSLINYLTNYLGLTTLGLMAAMFTVLGVVPATLFTEILPLILYYTGVAVVAWMLNELVKSEGF